MKSIYTILFTLISFGLFAQTAPDFSVTDTHGKEHNLYADYLDQGTTVVLDLFFVNCPPCNDLAPYLETAYQEWGAGTGGVEFISLTSDPSDDDEAVLGFEEQHGSTWPAVSADGGGPAAQQPYTDGTWGEFFGYPTLIVIAPDGTVQFDAWVGGDFPATIDVLNEWIENTGATKPVSNIDELENVNAFSISPNPVSNIAILSFDIRSEEKTNISIYNEIGQQIKTVFNGTLSAGLQTINLNTADLQSGIYFIKVNMNTEVRLEQFIKI